MTSIKKRSRHKLVLSLVIGAAGLVAACAPTPTDPSLACDQLNLGTARTAVTIVTDGGSPAFGRTVERFVSDAESAFASSTLGLEGEPGIVSILLIDSDGEVHDSGSFNLAGAGNEKVRKANDARQQAQCLKEAAATITQTPSDGANLLRALPTASALAAAMPADQGALLILGLARSRNDGFDVADSDLGTDGARDNALATLDGLGVLPDFDGTDLNVAFVAPGEGASTSVSASSIANFARDLCPLLNARTCSVAEVLA